jgi:hypothetical protein
MRRVLIVSIALVVLTAGTYPAWAQTSGRFYPETGHTLDSRFVPIFDEHGGLPIVGYPITEAFIDPEGGVLIQYTQNARFELIPNFETGELTPRLVPLGEAMGGWQLPLDPGEVPSTANSDCRYFPETGHQVCHAFLDYFEAQGGLAVFGYPISELSMENDRLVQYFQHFRLDWHPDDAINGAVQVAPLGRLHFEQLGYSRRLLRPSLPSDTIHYLPLDLSAHPSVLKPVCHRTDTQEVFIAVQDQYANPVEGATAFVIVEFDQGARTFVLPLTDQDGISGLVLPVEDQPIGSRVDLEYWIAYGDMLTITRDSFLIWW